LAEDALEVTIGEKDGSRAMPANKGCLLAKVRTIAGNYNLTGNATLPTFTGQTIYPALTGAQVALFQY